MRITKHTITGNAYEQIARSFKTTLCSRLHQKNKCNLVVHGHVWHVQDKESRCFILRVGHPTPYLWIPHSEIDIEKLKFFPWESKGLITGKGWQKLRGNTDESISTLWQTAVWKRRALLVAWDKQSQLRWDQGWGKSMCTKVEYRYDSDHDSELSQNGHPTLPLS